MQTGIIKITDQYDLQPIEQAVRMLNEGALVAFPTETVYGIGCRVDSAAIERLDQIKGRRPEKRYTLHLGSVTQITQYVPHVSLRARKLITNLLPGPLTMVFEIDDSMLKAMQKQIPAYVFEILYRDGTLGIRCPAHPVASEILTKVRYPIVAPSANPAGEEPAITAEQVSTYFNGLLDAIIETPSDETFKKSSSVVKIGKTSIQVLREGAIPAERIRQLSTARVLFVCTGNTCRSPMAEAICKKQFCNIFGCMVDELPDLGYIVESAGVAAMAGMPASEHAIQVCRQHNIPLQEHRSVFLTQQQIDESDLIFVMDQGHRQGIAEFNPEAGEKSVLLDENGDIADPIGQGLQAYQQCFEQIESSIKQRISEIL